VIQAEGWAVGASDDTTYLEALVCPEGVVHGHRAVVRVVVTQALAQRTERHAKQATLAHALLRQLRLQPEQHLLRLLQRLLLLRLELGRAQLAWRTAHQVDHQDGVRRGQRHLRCESLLE